MSGNHVDILRDRAKGSRADHGELSVMADELEAAADRIEELEQRWNDLPWEELQAKHDLVTEQLTSGEWVAPTYDYELMRKILAARSG